MKLKTKKMNIKGLVDAYGNIVAIEMPDKIPFEIIGRISKHDKREVVELILYEKT